MLNQTQDERRAQWRAKIDAHRDAQTCSICGKHLDYGDGYHTTSHSHWKCWVSERDALVKKRPAGLALLVANGGVRVHAVEMSTGRALCGHKPRDTAKRMKQRGRWMKHATADRITCDGCIKKNGGDVLTPLVAPQQANPTTTE